MKEVRSCVSSSIANFKEKILKRYGWKEYRFPRHILQPVMFFGMYHIFDYWRFLLHRGPHHVFWAGGDVLNLQKNTGIWRKVIRRVRADHICENLIEQALLKSMGLDARIQPIILDDPNQFEICYKWSAMPKMYLCAHKGSEEQYGVNLVEGIASTVADVEFHVYGISGTSHDNVKYHGQVSNEQFNEEIKHYQAALRLNDRDGFGEILAKAVLLGQWPISRIYYPYITHVKDTTDLINALVQLKYKREPNYIGEQYWRHEFNKPLI